MHIKRRFSITKKYSVIYADPPWRYERSKVQGARRVPEKTLFLLAILGGSVGAILGMRVWHHKTRHWYFKYGLPAILLAQLALAWYLGGLH